MVFLNKINNIMNVNGYIFKVKDVPALKTILAEVYLGNKKLDLNTRIDIEKRFSLRKN